MRSCLRALVAVAFAFACRGREDARSDSTAAAIPVDTPVAVVDSGARKLLPRDESDSSFRTFRTRTLEALARRDTTYLYAMLSPDIRNSFGPDDSVAGFRRIWQMDDPRTGVWSKLARVLQMGGQRTSDTSFVAPYVYAFWPDSLDAFAHVAVTSERAVVRRRPEATAGVIGTASYSILPLLEWSSFPEPPISADTTWAHVRLPNGADGWISAADAYNPVSWRAAFVKRQGRWIMVFFLAGD